MKTLRTPRRAPRGQAMVEYSIVSHFLLLGGGALMFFVFGKNGGLLDGLNQFYDSVYFVLENAAL